jgi:hypothetical protein
MFLTIVLMSLKKGFNKAGKLMNKIKRRTKKNTKSNSKPTRHLWEVRVV